ncbi:reverse transcriptase [Elysia marginata]|uniref:Reverse transcriptase n=1 Tax=Elysia marginata TaxID=1093978 RepID=A0AAV4EIL2_9GAST|nr:reverse transcriptase [Elysia marginata]
MKRYDLSEDGCRRKFRSCKPAEGESPDMFIVRIVTDLDRWIELSRTEKSYEKLKDLIVREQFMDACPEDLAISLQEKDLPTLERIAKEADLFLQARHRELCDQPRRVFQNNARPKVEPVRLIEPEKKLNSGFHFFLSNVLVRWAICGALLWRHSRAEWRSQNSRKGLIK